MGTVCKRNTHEVVKGRPAKTPLEVLCLLLCSTSSCSEEPSKSEETLHKLRTSLMEDFHQNPMVQNWYGTPCESLCKSGEAMSARRSERHLKARRRAIFFSSGISLPKQEEPFFTSSEKVFWQWELITGSGNALSILFPTHSSSRKNCA
nr:hypothetical protein [Tanacetum cinerariifolium]